MSNNQNETGVAENGISQAPAESNLRCYLPLTADRGQFAITIYGTSLIPRAMPDRLPSAPSNFKGKKPKVKKLKKLRKFHDFKGLIKYLAAAIEVPMGGIIQNYATLVSYFSHRCRHWELDNGKIPDAAYFEEVFPKCEPLHTGETVKYFCERLSDSILELKNLKIQGCEDPISWEFFWNQWPPQKVDGERKLVSCPFDIHIVNPDAKGEKEITEVKNVVVTLKLVMDCKGYEIPRGFTLEVSGLEYYIKVPEEHDPSSSSSSSSAYSSNPFGGG